MTSLPPNYLTASETAALVKAGKLSIVEPVQAHLDRYKERNPDVEAWVYLNEDRALNEAKRLDALPEHERGPLHGVILGVKDMIHMPTEHGSEVYKGHEPKVDAGIVTILRQAGALIYGKTVTTEFAFMTVGKKTLNPFDKRRTPGGSSSGSGAAVGDWQCQVALGTQTIGSMMRPSSFNGVFGFKPTFGAITKEGLKPSSLTLDTPGYFARSISDLRLITNALHIQDDIQPVSKPLSARRIAFVKTDQWAPSDRPAPSPELIRAWSRAQELLSAAGADIIELDLPSDFDGISRGLNLVVLNGETKTLFLPEYTTDAPARTAGRGLLHDEILAQVESRGEPAPNRTQYLAAIDRLAQLRPKMDQLIKQYDALITPSAPGGAPMGQGWTGDSRFCGMWTALHVPVINVPAFASESGMPLGLTVVGARFHDQHLLDVAEQVASVLVGQDADRLRIPPAPAGAKHSSI